MAEAKTFKVTAEEFKRYLNVQESGVTNMFDLRVVSFHTGLTRDKIIYIMEHYSELCEEFDK